MLKAVGIATTGGSFVVVCRDGSVWTYASKEWQQVAPPIPQPPKKAGAL
jgi:hypothetical protein